MVVDHAEVDLTTVAVDHHEEDHMERVKSAETVVGAAAVHTGVGGCSSEERNLGDSFVVPVAEVEGGVVGHVEGGHAAEDDDHSATGDQDNRLADLSVGQDLEDPELEGLCMVQHSADRYIQPAGLDLEEDPAASLGHAVGHCSHLDAGKREVNENHRGRLDFHLCRPWEHHHLVEVAASIRTADAAERNLLEEGQVEEEGEEGSCTAGLPTCCASRAALWNSARRSRSDGYASNAKDSCIEKSSLLMSKKSQ